MASSTPAKNGKSDDGAKDLSPSDLDPDELAKAIEESVAAESKPDKSTKSKKKENESTAQKEEKPEQSKTDNTASKTEESQEDKGVPIIVKRRSGYVAAPGNVQKDTQDSASDKPLEPPSKTQKTLDPETGDKQTVKEPSKTEEIPLPDKTADAKSETKSNEPQAPEPEAKPSNNTASTPQEPAKTTATSQTEAAAAPEGAKDPTQENKLQKPTVFDTTEYHLPIKARNRKYVNSAVAWVVLAVALAVAAGYVLYRLGVIEVGTLRILN